MHIRLRAEPGKRLRVLDAEGKEIEGIRSVDFHVDGGSKAPVVKIEAYVEVIVDAEAEVEKSPWNATAFGKEPVIPQPKGSRGRGI